MTLGRPPGPGSGRKLHGSVLENPFVFVSVPCHFSTTVVVTEKPCAEALPHQAMTKATAPAARIPFAYQLMIFIASTSARIYPRRPNDDALLHESIHRAIR